MSLTSDEIAYVAARASWRFDAQYPLTGVNGDWTLFIGDGLADLNSFIGRYEMTPNLKVFVDVGTMVQVYRPATIQDIRDIRTVFVATYGSVSQVSPFPPGNEFPTVFQSGTRWSENALQPGALVT